MSLAGLILAGGESSRMGSPKALLQYQGETFLDRLIGLLGEQCTPVVVVLGHGAEIIRAGARRAGEAVFVVNERYRDGQLTSLQCGLRAVPPEAGGVMFTPVDFPAVTKEVVAALAARFEEGALLAVPRYEGRRGHPVCCRRELFPEFLALPAGSQARVVVHRHEGGTVYVDAGCAGVVLDIDDPGAYERLLRGPELK